MSTRRDFLSVGLLTSVAGFVPASSAWAQGDSPSAKGLSYRTLGKTGLRVTSVGFGCMVTSDASVIARAADLGINYFDTCRGYQHGNNERLVATGLKGKRQNIILSSKTDGATKQAALQELDTSLSELGTDHLDIWYLHMKDSPGALPDELFEAQQIARQQGKIRFTGVSTHKSKDMVPFLLKKGATDVVLAAYNFTMDKAFSEAMAQANAAGLGVVAMKVMAGGSRRVKPEDPNAAKLKREGAMLAALKWVLKDSYIHTTIPSMTDMDQLDENLKAMTEPYTPHEEQLLARQLDFITPLYCRMCGECDGHCLKGLPVADVLRYAMYADGYGQFELGRDHFKKLPLELASVRCGDCPTCTVKCRFGVKVPQRLSRAQEMFA
ncbi:MAG TPA: aldo/keto reductase [Terriglobia bacterium]|nr:aldo/keto reductase [Terriglobia bacterium]